MLAAEEVSKRYADVVALDRVSVAVDDGGCLALVGESGAGKSTLLRCFNRLVDPDSGRITVHGSDARALDPIALRRRTGYVAQEGGLLPHWRVGRNVALVPWLQHEPRANERAAEALELVGLDPVRFSGRRPGELSGGQRQRAALARALAGRPDTVLLDEPFGALDAITRGELRESFAELRSRVRFTCVLVTHDLHEAIALATRIAVLRNGLVEQDATPAEMVSAPATEYVETLLSRAGVR
ncbi:MAG TPA: ATP-binding cassette domain-containing protein [Gemmatimonadales bacterium]|nr:ATP-binding cassette domain-containing protein [Gemmatimonadales bacterium]